jgi:hypothetical protein
MIVVVGERQTGRTSALLRWLIGGHPVDGWPGWSRVLVVPAATRIPQMLIDYSELQHAMRRRFEPAFGKLLISMHELSHVRRIADPGVSFAIDDADQIIAYSLSITPAVVSICGTPTDPDDPIEPGPPDDDESIPFRPTLAAWGVTMPEGGA